MNPAFACDLSDLIVRYQPEVWIHGHTYESFDYYVGGTRVVRNRNFDLGMVIEFPEPAPTAPGT